MSANKIYDLVVIGGGPGGGSCAYYAAKNGAKVCLVERRKILGVPLSCAEGISKSGLESCFQPRPNWIATNVSGAHLHAPSGIKITIHHPDAGYILERKIMERDIVGLSALAGAEIMTQTTAIDFIYNGKTFEGIIAVHRNKRIELCAKYVALACGTDNRLLNKLGLNPYIPPDDMIVSAEYVVGGIPVDEGYPEFFLGNEIAPGGYAWVFPKGNGLANVGIGVGFERLNGKLAVDFLNKFIHEHYRTRYEIIERITGVVPVCGPLKHLVHKNVMLIGDAGRVCDPFSGGGIANALLSGKLAGEAVAKALSGEDLKIYENNFFALKGRELEVHRIARKILITLSDKELNELGAIVDELYGGKTFSAIDSIEFLKEIFLKHPRILLLARKLIPALFK